MENKHKREAGIYMFTKQKKDKLYNKQKQLNKRRKQKMKQTLRHYKDHKAGQLLLEALCLVLFACAFLALLSHLYEKGKQEIHTSRVGKYTSSQNYKNNPQDW